VLVSLRLRLFVVSAGALSLSMLSCASTFNSASCVCALEVSGLLSAVLAASSEYPLVTQNPINKKIKESDRITTSTGSKLKLLAG
jgi:hypothetical protein